MAKHSIRKRIKTISSNPDTWEAFKDFIAKLAVLGILAYVSVVVGYDVLELF